MHFIVIKLKKVRQTRHLLFSLFTITGMGDFATLRLRDDPLPLYKGCVSILQEPRAAFTFPWHPRHRFLTVTAYSRSPSFGDLLATFFLPKLRLESLLYRLPAHTHMIQWVLVSLNSKPHLLSTFHVELSNLYHGHRQSQTKSIVLTPPRHSASTKATRQPLMVYQPIAGHPDLTQPTRARNRH